MVQKLCILYQRLREKGNIVSPKNSDSLCPICQQGLLLFRDYRKRIIRYGDGTCEWLRTPRHRCNNPKCNRRHRMFHDLLLLYKHYAEENISRVLDGVVNPDDADSEICPSEQTMIRWHHWFMRNRLDIEGQLKSICSDGASASSYGQNAFFYDAAEGLLAPEILLIAEYCSLEKRHIISVFKLIQNLLALFPVKNRSLFHLLMNKFSPTHKAKWFAGAALNSALNTETFCTEKSAIFIVLPEDNTGYFMVPLFLQRRYREMLTIADEHGGKMLNRVMMLADEIGTIPQIESMEMMFSTGRSRRISMVPIIQSFAKLEKNYGKEGSSIIIDNCQDILLEAFVSNSESAEILSKALGNRIVLWGFHFQREE